MAVGLLALVLALAHALMGIRPEGATSEADLKRSLRSVQAAMLIWSLLCNATVTCIVADALELLQTFGHGAVASGWLIGGCWALLWVCPCMLRGLPDLPQDRTKGLLVASYVNLAALCLIYAVCANPPWWFNASSGARYGGLFITRFSMGLTFGVPHYALAVMAANVTPKSEQVQYGILVMCCQILGTCMGPAFSVLSAAGAVEARAASAQLLLATSWAMAALLLLRLVPSSVGYSALLKAKQRADHVAEFAATPALPGPRERLASMFLRDRLMDGAVKVQKRIWWTGLLYGFKRSLTVSALDAATTMILEQDFGWTDHQSAVGIALILLVGLLVIVGVDFLRRRGTLADGSVLRGSVVACAAGTLLLLPQVGTALHAEKSWVLVLVASSIIFSAAFLANGIAEGLVMKNAIPYSGYSVESYQFIGPVAVQGSLGRLLGPPVARFLFVSYGGLGYALAQATLASLSCFTVFKLAADALPVPPANTDRRGG